MSEEQTKLIKWFKKQEMIGNGYDECIKILLSTREIGKETDKDLERIYNIFVYMPDEEWEEVKKLLI